MIGGAALGRVVVLASVTGLLGCRQVPAEIAVAEPAAPIVAEPEPDPDPENAPLVCRSELLAIIGEEGLSMVGHEALMSLERRKYSDRGREMPRAAELRYRRSIADRLIDQRLLELEAARLGVHHDEAALREREVEQRRGIEDWDAYLRRRGETEATLRALHIAELRERAILDHRGALTVSPDEVQAEYDTIAPSYDRKDDRVRARHILIKVDPDRVGRASEAEARAEARRLAALANQPDVDFAELARAESDGPSAARGGDLGIFSADRMVEDFSKPVFKAKPGEIVVTQTKFGFHVVLVEGHWGPGPLPLEALEEQIIERFASRKLNAGRSELKDELRERYEPQNCEDERRSQEPG
ncbi:putative peptidyl-prolyl cis-trans isomerase Cbf2 precursor [Enhygromyxa salina]|uniref:Putative peptidyl-prolyl cis-trans isomerase Cbf2 n=1 Tax=Enhygromyxa salina TaxID=215803 RepID=A0A2S9XIZ9_9BACT|nr:peptidylprolyl isomerase [Enhygromyxa salina]PRP92856.1 putative peptidyl-prolyl cis-trans isomerase Cbf2 precursor [Enhygromyxa salina]